MNGYLSLFLMLLTTISSITVITKHYFAGKLLLIGTGVGYFIFLARNMTMFYAFVYFTVLSIVGILLIITAFILLSLKRKWATVVCNSFFFLLIFVIDWNNILTLVIGLLNGIVF